MKKSITEMNVIMRFDENNNWMISERNTILLWEPGRNDEIYRLAIVLSNDNKRYGSFPKQPNLKVMFVDSEKYYDSDEINKKCFFPYHRKKYNEEKDKTDKIFVKGQDWLMNYTAQLRSFRWANDVASLARKKHQDNPQQIKLILDYLDQKLRDEDCDWARYLYDNEEGRTDRDYSYLQIPYYKVKEIDTELVQLQEKFFEKDQKTDKEPKKPTSLTEKLKKQYLEPEQGR